jgi:hypothetical protein
MPTPITLKVFRGNELVRTEQFNREIIKIGRLSSAHLCLDDEKISRIHSVIEVAPDGAIWIIDMGSAEGTFVNGKKVSRGALRPGDQITIGGLRIVLEGVEAQNVAVGVGSAGVAASDGVNRAVAAPQLAAPRPAARNGTNGTNGTNGHAHGTHGHATHGTNGHGHAHAAAAAVAVAPAPPPVAPPEPVKRPSSAPARAPFHLRPAERGVEDLSAAADLGVELRLLWGETLLEAVTFVRPPKPVLVGDGRDCAIRVEGLQVPQFPMLRCEGGEYQFAFGTGMTGVVEERGARTAFGDLVRSRKALPDSAVKGAYWIPVPKAGAIRAEVGHQLAIEARPRVPQKVKAAPIWERLNYQLLNLFLVLFFLQSGFIVAARDYPYDSDVVADDLFKNPSRMAKFIIKPPEVAKPQPMEKLAGEKKDDPGEMAEKHRGDEGKMGKKDAPKSNGRSAPKAIDPNAKEVVRRSGLLGALGRGAGGGLSTVFGSGGLGGDLKGAVGNMFGPVVGDAQGLGGLGIRGSGSGGGGSGETIGIGAVGTKGRGGGLGNYGTGVGGLGKKGDHAISVATGTAQVMGSIDRELVRKVIQDHAAQIRYCYEQQLAVNPKLAGKVSIKWVINGDGSASLSEIVRDATTLDDGKVHECMMSRITTWAFPKPKGGGQAIITYPWILRSAGGE